MNFFKDYVEQMSRHISLVDLSVLGEATQLITRAHEKNGKVIIAGNGGSASIASHVSVDLTKNTSVRAMNFNEANLITCFSNDFGYERWVEKALEYYSQENDVVILISSSGRSANIVNAALKAKELNLKLITFSGFDPDNPLRHMGDINFWVDNHHYNIIEMTHHIWLLAIVDKLGENMKPISTMTHNQVPITKR